MPRRIRCLPVSLLSLVMACGGDGGAMSVDAGPAVQLDPKSPPMGHGAIEAWLAAGYYRQWTCERAISDPRADPLTPLLKGTHKRHRICSNEILLGSTDGPYPIGASSVKELFDAMDRPNGYAISLKVAAGTGMKTWYWYERVGTLSTLTPVADGIGDATCGGDCHGNARRDFTFFRAQ